MSNVPTGARWQGEAIETRLAHVIALWRA